MRENQVDGKTVLELSDEDFTEELGLKRLQVFVSLDSIQEHFKFLICCIFETLLKDLASSVFRCFIFIFYFFII